MKKIFELHQNVRFFVNEYKVLKDGELAAFARQKRLAVREQFKLHADQAQKDIIATSKARNIMDVAPVFDIFDDQQKRLAIVKKDFKKSLLSSTWHIFDPREKRLFTVEEKSYNIALFRRLWNFLPLLNEFPFPLKFHFNIYAEGKIAGEYQKITLFRDRYQLLLDDRSAKKLDERAWMVMAVLLDAMQSR